MTTIWLLLALWVSGWPMRANRGEVRTELYIPYVVEAYLLPLDPDDTALDRTLADLVDDNGFGTLRTAALGARDDTPANEFAAFGCEALKGWPRVAGFGGLATPIVA